MLWSRREGGSGEGEREETNLIPPAGTVSAFGES